MVLSFSSSSWPLSFGSDNIFSSVPSPLEDAVSIILKPSALLLRKDQLLLQPCQAAFLAVRLGLLLLLNDPLRSNGDLKTAALAVLVHHPQITFQLVPKSNRLGAGLQLLKSE